MELGNMLFGHSRGEFRVDRGLTTVFIEYLEKMNFSSYGTYEGSDHNGFAFENDVFRIQPYWWGECECFTDVCKCCKCPPAQAEHACHDADCRLRDDETNHENNCIFADESKMVHKPDCFEGKPNFTFKPTGFELSWYKYPFRDSYSSEKLTAKKLVDMMEVCLKSLEKTWWNENKNKNKDK